MKKLMTAACVMVAACAVAMAQGSTNDQSGAVNQNGSTNQTGSMDKTSGQTAQQSMMTGAVDDAHLTAMIKAVNEGEIKAGRLAEKKAKSKDVKSFARMMIKEHTQNNSEIAAVSKRIGLQPTENDQITSMKDDMKKDMEGLQGQSGEDFDKQYVDQMVTDHQKALDQLNKALQNNQGRNEQVDGLLKKTIQAVQKHLDHAQKLQAQLGGSSEGSNNRGGQQY